MRKQTGMKRMLTLLLLLSLLLSLTACGKPETQLEKTASYLQAQGAGDRFHWRRLACVWAGALRREGFTEILRYLL
jgi:hypothetical protein